MDPIVVCLRLRGVCSFGILLCVCVCVCVCACRVFVRVLLLCAGLLVGDDRTLQRAEQLHTSALASGRAGCCAVAPRCTPRAEVLVGMSGTTACEHVGVDLRERARELLPHAYVHGRRCQLSGRAWPAASSAAARYRPARPLKLVAPLRC